MTRSGVRSTSLTFPRHARASPSPPPPQPPCLVARRPKQWPKPIFQPTFHTPYHPSLTLPSHPMPQLSQANVTAANNPPVACTHAQPAWPCSRERQLHLPSCASVGSASCFRCASESVAGGSTNVCCSLGRSWCWFKFIAFPVVLAFDLPILQTLSHHNAGFLVVSFSLILYSNYFHYLFFSNKG